jgi:hypothetical protein
MTPISVHISDNVVGFPGQLAGTDTERETGEVGDVFSGSLSGAPW